MSCVAITLRVMVHPLAVREGYGRLTTARWSHTLPETMVP